MPGYQAAEIYFIVAMMILILIVSFAVVYFFFREYNREMRNKKLDRAAKLRDKASEDAKRN